MKDVGQAAAGQIALLLGEDHSVELCPQRHQSTPPQYFFSDFVRS